ncbi:MMPL family transporter [Rothia sp. ZJ932]|uniref:MMPL family transporter n=1 Tax=Rothia sp. ZJ932 TaxID=2810516 RepID=UPI001968354D|nr:MMPL family transporter [Rothia sp. ZJ932]QRZ61938.1 MMPL family transporter [Rothia sp. ZJ932]
MAHFLYKIGDFAAHRAWAVIAIWALILAGLGGAYTAFKGEMSDEISIPGTEAQSVQEQLQEVFNMNANAANGKVIVQTEDGTAFTDAQRQAVADAAASAQEVEGVDSVLNPFTALTQIEEGKAQLDEARNQLNAGSTEVEQGRQKLDAAQARIDDTRARFKANQAPQEAWDEFNANAQRLEENRKQLEDTQRQLDESQNQVNEARSQLEASAAPPEAFAELDARQAEIDGGRAQLESGWEQFRAGEAELNAGREQLENFTPTEQMWAELEAGQAEVKAGREQLEAGAAEAEAGAAEIERNTALLEMNSNAVMVNDNNSTAVVGVTFEQEVGSVSEQTLTDARVPFDSLDDARLKVTYDQNMNSVVPQMNLAGEIIGIAVAFVILVLMLGSLVAAGLPILMALVGVGASVLGTMALSGVIDMTSTTPMLGTMLGLAVGIDYTLFILNRHRNNLAQGMPLHRSIAMAVGTSGSAVVFAGITVMIALIALNVVGISFLSTMGNAAAFAVFMGVAVAITLAPAVLSLVGSRIVSGKRWAEIQRHNNQRNSFNDQDAVEAKAAAHARDEKATGWLKTILRAPWVTIAASVALLALIAAPVTALRLGLPDATSEKQDSAAYRAYTTMAAEFGEGVNGPIIAAADLPEGTTAEQAQELQVSIGQTLGEQENVDAVIPAMIAKDNSMLLYQITPVEGPSAESTENLVHSLRELSVPTNNGDISFGVTGQAAMAIDISENLFSVLPVYVAIVMGLSLLVLVLVFRSILVPLTASVGFLFSLLAALGATTAVFQWGFGGALFGVHTPGPILSFLPILLVGILFGLAMDYQVFLVSGMREAYAHGRDATVAVTVGYNHNAKVVVAAALIMIGVFVGFVFSGEAMIASIGFALAAGVLFDAFVVRMTLIPALMHLLGEKAWWFPEWLDKLLPDLDVEGTKLEEQMTAAPHDAARSTAKPSLDKQGANKQSADEKTTRVSVQGDAVQAPRTGEEPAGHQLSSGESAMPAPTLIPPPASSDLPSVAAASTALPASSTDLAASVNLIGFEQTPPTQGEDAPAPEAKPVGLLDAAELMKYATYETTDTPASREDGSGSQRA